MPSRGEENSTRSNLRWTCDAAAADPAGCAGCDGSGGGAAAVVIGGGRTPLVSRPRM